MKNKIVSMMVALMALASTAMAGEVTFLAGMTGVT
jgi:hypothetical protein